MPMHPLSQMLSSDCSLVLLQTHIPTVLRHLRRPPINSRLANHLTRASPSALVRSLHIVRVVLAGDNFGCGATICACAILQVHFEGLSASGRIAGFDRRALLRTLADVNDQSRMVPSFVSIEAMTTVLPTNGK